MIVTCGTPAAFNRPSTRGTTTPDTRANAEACTLPDIPGGLPMEQTTFTPPRPGASGGTGMDTSTVMVDDSGTVTPGPPADSAPHWPSVSDHAVSPGMGTEPSLVSRTSRCAVSPTG